jgi:hypothetical protein
MTMDYAILISQTASLEPCVLEISRAVCAISDNGLAIRTRPPSFTRPAITATQMQLTKFMREWEYFRIGTDGPGCYA